MTPEIIHSPDAEFNTYHVQGTLLGAESLEELGEG